MQSETKRALAFLLVALAALVSISLFVWMEGVPQPAKWIEKCFSYDIDNEYWTYPPVEGLNVTFGEGKTPLWSQLTDACGCATFGSGLPDGSYWMEWNWGGEAYHEDFTINCSQLVWHFENYLPAKGRGTPLTIVEWERKHAFTLQGVAHPDV